MAGLVLVLAIPALAFCRAAEVQRPGRVVEDFPVRFGMGFLSDRAFFDGMAGLSGAEKDRTAANAGRVVGGWTDRDGALLFLDGLQG